MTVTELIKALLKYDLNDTVMVFYDRDYKQGDEPPVIVTEPGFVIIAAASDQSAVERWVAN